MKIFNVRDNMDDLEEVMELIFEEWGSNFSSSRESKMEKMKTEIMSNDKFPQIYVLKDEEDIIGTFSILDKELKGSELSPWLACVVVAKKYRNKGYGNVLLDHIKKVIESDYEVIYLTTSMVGFYEKIGFDFVDFVDNGENNRLYCKKC